MSTSSPPRPIYTPPEETTRLVPRGWLEHSPVTRTLLALNVCLFVVEAMAGSAFNLGGRQALALGAADAFAVLAEHRYETLITACFLHAGLMHLGFNMLALWQAGPLVERGVGSARMAPLYLVSGAFGNLLSVLVGWLSGAGTVTVGASGAISGVIAAALVVGWRTTGWRGPLTQAMFRWLAFVFVFGILSNLGGAHIANSAHLGGALAGGAIAALWRRGYRYSSRATAAVLAACAGVLLASVGLVVYHDRTDRFAVMDRGQRARFTGEALMDGRCGDAAEGLQATERLGWNEQDVAALRAQVETICGHSPK